MVRISFGSKVTSSRDVCSGVYEYRYSEREVLPFASSIKKGFNLEGHFLFLLLCCVAAFRWEDDR